MKIISNNSTIVEKKIELPLPEITEKGEVKVPEILGRKKDSHVSPLTKELIAIDVITGRMRQNDVALIHGTSQAEVSAASRGFNTTNIDTRKEDVGLKEVINKRRESIADIATAKLLSAVDIFDPSEVSHKNLPGVALRLAGVVEKVTQGFSGETGPSVNFIVYAPRMRKEESYEVIDGND